MPAVGFSSLINDTSPFLPHTYSGFYLEIASTFFKAVINNE